MLVHEDNKPRGFWRLARVKSLIDGNDGCTRGAILTMIYPNEKRMTLRRSWQRLYLFEVEAVKRPEVIDNRDDDASEISDEEPAAIRLRRAAAPRLTACSRLSLWMNRRTMTVDAYSFCLEVRSNLTLYVRSIYLLVVSSTKTVHCE